MPARATWLRASLWTNSGPRMASMAAELELPSAAEAGSVSNVIKASASALNSNFAVLISPQVI